MASSNLEPTYYHGQRRAGGWVDVRRRLGANSAPLYADPAWSGGVAVDYAWGRAGPGAEVLALAIMADVLGSSSLARWWAEDYAREVVALWEGDSFLTNSHKVCAWLIEKTVAKLRKDDPSIEARLRERIFRPGCGGAGEGTISDVGGASVN